MTRVPQREELGEPALAAIIGRSPAIEHLRAMVRRLARCDVPVLILGPSGAGKELVASALHAASGRRGPFVAFNVCAIPETMFESQVFGHVRGAFTGATADYPGFLVEADGGTAFLDEIGGLGLSGQGKLLRAVETHTFRPVGARGDRRSGFRLVAATNADLERLEAEGRFRQDLLHRLCAGVVLRVPPLRERLEDVPLLCHHFLDQACDRLGRVVSLDTGAVVRLCHHEWPGNVRELRAVVERAAIMAEHDLLAAEDVVDAMQALGTNGRHPDAPLPRPTDVVRPLAAVVREAQATAIAAAITRAQGDRAAAAGLLGISVATLQRRLATYRSDDGPRVGDNHQNCASSISSETQD